MRSLEDHLSPHELASLPGSPEALASGGPDWKQMILHLESCESCAELLHTYSVLRSLGTPAKAAKVGEGCPNQIDWLEFANGLRPEEALSFPAHAASCDACAVVLQEALSLMEPDLTHPDQFDQASGDLAGLASSTPEWQNILAARLHRDHTLLRPEPSSKSSWTSSLAAFLSPVRLAFAVLFVALALFGIKEHRRADSTSNQLLSFQAVQQQIHDEALHSPYLQHDSKTSGVTYNAGYGASSASTLQSPNHEELASLELEPGLTRGAGETKRLSIAPGAKFAEITLRKLNLSSGILREELVAVGDQVKWSQELRPAQSAKAGDLLLSIPAYLLTPADYQIVVKQKSDNTWQEIASYNFRVSR